MDVAVEEAVNGRSGLAFGYFGYVFWHKSFNSGESCDPAPLAGIQ